MSLTDIGSASNLALFHSVSITRCWGCVSPSGSGNGRYTASTASSFLRLGRSFIGVPEI
jgi:hypothetical protein